MSTSPPDPGRSVAWRVGVAAGGILAVGAGASLVLWPGLLAYAVGGALAVVGLLMLLSALAARGRT